jgi:hypothetical protein
MTENDAKWEVDSGLFSKVTYNNHSNIFSKKKRQQSVAHKPTMRNKKKDNNNNKNMKSREEECVGKLDFSTGLSHHFLKKIVKLVDFEKARENILEDKKEGQCLTERLQKIPKMTAAS